jgi:hypothetical protein
VVVYSGYVSLMGADGLARGADAYLDKADDESALVEKIRAVAGWLSFLIMLSRDLGALRRAGQHRQ